MKIITTREIVRQTKTYFDLAEKETVVVKRGDKFVALLVTHNPETKFISEEWIKEFMDIPAEYRINPFEVSPSGDLFFADKRNLEHVEKARQDIKIGRVTAMKEGQSVKSFLEELCTE